MGFFQKFKTRLKAPKRSTAEQLVRRSDLETGERRNDVSAEESDLHGETRQERDSSVSKKPTKAQIFSPTGSKNATKKLFRIPARKYSFWRSQSRNQSTTNRKVIPPTDSLPALPSHTSMSLPLSLDVPLENIAAQVIRQVSSLVHLASAYSSGSASPEPDSIFGPHSTRSTNPSPASTISTGLSGYGNLKVAVAAAPRVIDPAFVPEPLNINHGTFELPVEIVHDRPDSRTSVEGIQNMQATLYADSDCSSCEEEAGPSSLPEQTSLALFIDQEASKRLSAVVNDAAADLTQYAERLRKEAISAHPPVTPKSSVPNSAIGLALTTDSVAELETPTIEAPFALLRSSSINSDAHERTGKWLGKQPQDRDPFTGPSSSPSFRPYTRPNKQWYAARERFMEIFDDIPSSKASARRENPKLYQMRKRRTLLEMGLTEHDLLEEPTTERGEEIMVLLDGLEERLQREREDEAQRERLEEAKVGLVRKPKRISNIGVHCANDVRSGYGFGAARGDGYGMLS